MESDLPSQARADADAKAMEAMQRRVRVYFKDSDSGDWAAEERSIFRTPTPAGQASQALAELMAGPRSAGHRACVPQRLRLRHVLLAPDGTAFVDLSLKFLNAGDLAGSERELEAVASIVRTLSDNFPEIRSVRFLVEGREAETLAGHVSLAFPWRNSHEPPAGGEIAEGEESGAEESSGESHDGGGEVS